MSIPSAEGTFGRPGMSITSPDIGIKYPAPVAILISLIFSLHPVGTFSFLALSEKDNGVLAIQTGSFSSPSFLISFRDLFFYTSN